MADRPESALREFPVLRIESGQRQPVSDSVIAECAIALSYNGSVYAVMLATPADLEDFAFGFSLSAGIIEQPGQLRLIETLTQAHGLILEMLIPQARFDAAIGSARRLPGTAGCGLCGSESLAAVIRDPPPLGRRLRVEAVTIAQAIRDLAGQQTLNRASGGVHAAGYLDGQGLTVREDIGRHNALDKLIGAIREQPERSGFVVISSRASYELVHKAASAGIELLAAVSAPSSLAIELAERVGLTLVAFVRGERLNVYTHAGRVQDAGCG